MATTNRDTQVDTTLQEENQEINNLLYITNDFLALKRNLTLITNKINEIDDDKLENYLKMLLQHDPKKFTYAFHFLKAHKPLKGIINSKNLLPVYNESELTKYLNQLTELFNAKKELINDEINVLKETHKNFSNLNPNSKGDIHPIGEQENKQLAQLRKDIDTKFNFLQGDVKEINFYKTKALVGLVAEGKFFSKISLVSGLCNKKTVENIIYNTPTNCDKYQETVNSIVIKINESVAKLRKSMFYTNAAMAKADALGDLADLIQTHKGNLDSLNDLILQWEKSDSNYFNNHAKAAKSPLEAGKIITNVALMQQQRGLFKWHKLSDQTDSKKLIDWIKDCITIAKVHENAEPKGSAKPLFVSRN